MLIKADARAIPLRDGCVQCVVTSPPYFGLRDYGTAGQIGLERSPSEYVESLRVVFREVHRVLRDDGTLWLNLGDCYNSGTTADRNPSNNHGGDGYGKHGYWTNPNITKRVNCESLKTKDLVGIPWRVAFALQADGWYLRSDIIWSKPNPMPESVTDRPTKAHEYLFLLSKSERYRYDADAIREPLSAWELRDGEMVNTQGGQGFAVTRRAEIYPGMAGKTLPGNMAPGKHIVPNIAGRNKRSVWHIPTQAYPESHFATFPEALVEPCILAGSRLGDLVLDPFCGSGTTLRVAERYGRRAVGMDLSYHELARKRTAQRGLRFVTQDDALEDAPNDPAVQGSQENRSTCRDRDDVTTLPWAVGHE